MSDLENGTTDAAGDMQRAVQDQQDRQHQQDTHQEENKEPVQTGNRDYPTPPLPAQHLEKPGTEAEMQLKPQFLAHDYCGSGKLAGLVAIITGGDSGIGRAVAVLYAREGADVAIIYQNEHEDANETKHYVEAEGQACLLIAGDVRDSEFCRNATEQVLSTFGRIDILVNNAAFQEHAESLMELSEERFDLTGFRRQNKLAIDVDLARPLLRKCGCGCAAAQQQQDSAPEYLFHFHGISGKQNKNALNVAWKNRKYVAIDVL